MKCIIEDLLWTDYSEMNLLGIPMGRRMILARSRCGKLIVWSPGPATKDTVDKIKELDSAPIFILQSILHDRYFDFFFGAFPDSEFWATPGAYEAHKDWPLKKLQSKEDLPEGINYLEVKGMPKVREHVFLHHETASLIVADLFFNVPKPDSGLAKLMCKMADIGGEEPRPSRLERALIKDRKAFTESIREILNWKFDRVLLGHGEIVSENAHDVVINAFREWLEE